MEYVNYALLWSIIIMLWCIIGHLKDIDKKLNDKK